eukprot:CAMPEP_0181291404 /NCGR_PEP_ID=MMETSP1101-20121128/1948_1 /TAXON_ID=46948 /ORGANISM="Rhodomonas abbreviata, Strain Caron Lab Isolate" /LENGTH=1755 /DNA_ID=CAMNT_0023395791 /DNA_START=9 /DNA_END=5276 /DNA_ORIENTATION=-
MTANQMKEKWKHRRSRSPRGQNDWPDPNKYNSRSWFLFTLRNPLRKAAIAGIENKWWDRTVLLFIFLNTVQLALDDPMDKPEFRPYSLKRDVLNMVSKVFSILFTAECVIKVFALGLMVGPKTYLKEAWNWLDFFIVIVGILDFLPGSFSNLSSLRTLRVMRPLRAINKFPKLRFLTALLLQCIPLLSNVLGFCCFIFFVFGILAVQLFSGTLRGVCYGRDTGLSHGDSRCTLGGGMAECPIGYECLLLGTNPGQGTINFDSIGGAMVTIFQVMTLEGWTDLLYDIQDAYHFAVFLYFVVLIFVGPIFAIQLFLVVISTKFAETKESMKQMEVQGVASLQNDENEGNGDNKVAPAPEEPNKGSEDASQAPTVDTDIPDGKIKAANLTVHVDEDIANGNDAEKKTESTVMKTQSVAESTVVKTQSSVGGESPINRRGKPVMTGTGAFRWKLRMLANSDRLANLILFVIVINTLTMMADHNCDMCNVSWCPKFKGALEFANVFFAIVFLAEMIIKILGLGFNKYVSNYLNLFDALIVIASLVEIRLVVDTFFCYMEKKECREYEICEEGGGGGFTVLRTFRLVRVVKLLRAFPDVQKQIKILVSVFGSVAALNALMLIFLLIFCILGMNVFGGTVVEEWDPSTIALGSRVYVEFPWHDGGSRYATVVGMDHYNHSSSPWQVKVAFGEEEQVWKALNIPPDGMVWAADKESAGVGVPAIVDITPRMNFDDIIHAGVTVFQVLTLSNWNQNLYSAVSSNSPASGLYYFALIAVGSWMLLNLFIAILIQGFAEQQAVQLLENMQAMQERLLEKLGGMEEDKLAMRIEALFDSIDTDQSGVIDKYELKNALSALNIELRPRELQDMLMKYDVDGSGSIDFDEFLGMIKELVKKAEVAVHGAPPTPAQENAFEDAKEIRREKVMSMPTGLDELYERSLFCLRHSNRFRMMCIRLSEDSRFDGFILLCILFSSCSLAMDNPSIGDDSPMRLALQTLDLILNAAFTVECVSKVVAQSFKRYIKSGWNKLDFLIVLTSLLDTGLSYGLQGQNVNLGALKIFRIFRIFRALRPLRIIARARGLRVLVTTLLSSVKPVLNTMSIALGVFSIFGVLGMQLLSGKLHSCSDPTVYERDNCVGRSNDGVPRTWENYAVNFDNIVSAVRALFILATQDEWDIHMWVGVDATSKKTGPYQNYAEGIIFYYVACIVAAGFLVVNIFVGVFVDCYTAAAAELELGPKEKVKKLPEVFDDPRNPARVSVLSVVTSSAFDLFIAFFILVNVITMSMESFKQAEWQSTFGKVSNFFFTYVFGFECLAKLWAFFPRRYYVNSWNRFDYFIVMISFGGIVVDNLGTAVAINPTMLRILRVFRVFRILRAFRIFKAAKGLQAIVNTLVNSLPAIMNLFSMLGLLFFIYGVLGVMVFGSLCTEDDKQLPGLKAARCLFTEDDNLLSPHANFKNVGFALLALLRVATGDNWGEVLATCQLWAGSRKVSEESWQLFVSLLGKDPSTLPPTDAGFLQREDKNAALEIAKHAVRAWHAMTLGLDEDRDWPFPMASRPRSLEWIYLGQMVLPGCLTDSEAFELQNEGLADCDVGGYSKQCESTCGSSIAANAIFLSFVCVSQFVLLQLVIAVLMEQLSNTQNATSPTELMPGSDFLQRPIFVRLYRRWRWNALRRLKHRRVLEVIANRVPTSAGGTARRGVTPSAPVQGAERVLILPTRSAPHPTTPAPAEVAVEDKVAPQPAKRRRSSFTNTTSTDMGMNERHGA